MIIKELSIKNFRNYLTGNINFDKNANIIYGDNAQGKTNILEAIFMCATTKSQRTRYDKEMIKFNESDAHIRSVIEKLDKEFVIDIHLKNNGSKGVAINKYVISKVSELFDIVDIVFFAPEDLNIIRNSPSDRRKWLDYKLSSISKNYYNALLNYNKALKNRNIILHNLDNKSDIKDTLFVWDSQLINYGSKIISYRRDFIKKINEIIKPVHRDISGNRDKLNIIYSNNVDESNYQKKLNLSVDRDKKLMFTTVGPHKDDIIFIVNDKDAKHFASVGQQKTVIVALKLSEIVLIDENKNDKPILLLDDVLSELDSKRQNQLMSNIKDIQTIITCTGVDDFVKMRYNINRLFYVENGTVKPAR